MTFNGESTLFTNIYWYLYT